MGARVIHIEIWSVEDKLPLVGVRVLAWWANQWVFAEYDVEEGWWDAMWSEVKSPLDGVEYWALLPEGPEVGSGDA